MSQSPVKPMVMVDELRAWPVSVKGQAGRWFGGGKLSAHLTVEGELEDLHAFAERIGMRREWFQAHPIAPHYDLTPKRHAAALLAGAVLVSARDQARRRHDAKVSP